MAHDDAGHSPSAKGRLVATAAALVAGTFGYAFAAALVQAKTADAFLVPPTGAEVAGYGLWLGALTCLALAVEFGGPPIAVRGGRAARGLRAAIRKRIRHGRTRADIGNAEVGLAISACALLLALAAGLATTKALLAVVMLAAIYVALRTIWSLCRLVGYDPGWSALIGFLWGIAAGNLLA